MNFTIRIADLNIRIFHLYPQTRIFCLDYLVNDEPDFSISVSRSDIEREKSIIEDKKAGSSVRNFSDSYLETLVVHRKIANQVIDYNTILFHGSAVAVDGVGYLFTAKSGTGKSTHTRLWREYFGESAIMVNDDKPLLKITDRDVMVYGTPWDGKHHLSHNISVPLKAICILERAKINHIESISSNIALPMILQQSYRPKNPLKMAKTLELVDRILNDVAHYKLGCNMDIEAAKVAYNMMNQ